MIPFEYFFKTNFDSCIRFFRKYFPKKYAKFISYPIQREKLKNEDTCLGSSVGVAITYPLCAFVISLYGWEAVFYLASAISILW